MKKGIFLVNLGSPDSTKTKDVKRYLREFLMDKRVIDIPYLLRVFLLEIIILPRRPKKTAAAYKSIWWKEGSPLIVISKRLQKKIQKLLNVPVVLGMRYGNPSIAFGLEELKRQGVDDFLLLPLYPQYAMATYETVIMKVREELKMRNNNMKMSVIQPFYDHPKYIEVLSESIKPYLSEKNHILFSYHGVPERHIYKGDPTKSFCKIDGECCKKKSITHGFCYRHQCYKSTELVTQRLGLKEEQYTTTFQSRFGKDPWIRPFTDETLEAMPPKGIKNLIVVCPAFTADCLETLEEIGEEGKEIFLEAGGENYTLVPCLNDNKNWVNTLKEWSEKWLQK